MNYIFLIHLNLNLNLLSFDKFHKMHVCGHLLAFICLIYLVVDAVKLTFLLSTVDDCYKLVKVKCEATLISLLF